MTIFRPCIDLHAGQVKQIVGATLNASAPSDLRTNHVSAHPAAYYAALYKTHQLRGAHVVMLGPGNDAAAREALSAWPDALQVGGGISAATAKGWIEAGAHKVILTSHLFPNARFDRDRLAKVLEALGGDVQRLVIDLSCRRRGETWVVATDKWQTLTEFELNAENLRMLEAHCSEFLIHAADVEGLQRGIDEDLVRHLAGICSIPVTYAGGAKSVDDLARVKELSGGRIDVTIGSALDVFGGSLVKFDDCVKWNESQVA